MITVFTMITVTTKNLITGRKARILQPFIKFGTVVKESVSPTELTPVIIDMIECQKERFGFSAAGAYIAAIGPDSFVLKTKIVVKAMVTMLCGIINVPLCSSFNVTRTGMVPTVISKPNAGTRTPFNTIIVKAFLTLATVPGLLVFRLMASGTGFNHGVTSIIKTLSDYGINVKGKVQRPSRKGVGASVPKRLAARTADDMVCSA